MMFPPGFLSRQGDHSFNNGSSHESAVCMSFWDGGLVGAAIMTIHVVQNYERTPVSCIIEVLLLALLGVTEEGAE